jgi:hypothetical protein
VATCVSCGRDNLTTSALAFWTANVVSRQTDYVSHNRMRTTTVYSDFKHHSYQVCRRCVLVKRWLPIIGSILLFFILVVPLGMMNKAGVSASISTPIMLVITIVIVVGVIALARSWAPTRLALVERRTVDPKGKFAILSDKEYTRLTGKLPPAA